eukprot:Skav231983  [mRNA]  locus=scaffold719:166222:167791:- [translate_table: standard]
MPCQLRRHVMFDVASEAYAGTQWWLICEMFGKYEDGDSSSTSEPSGAPREPREPRRAPGVRIDTSAVHRMVSSHISSSASKETKEFAKEFAKEVNEAKEVKEVNEAKQVKEAKEVKEVKEEKEVEEVRVQDAGEVLTALCGDQLWIEDKSNLWANWAGLGSTAWSERPQRDWSQAQSNGHGWSSGSSRPA